MSAETKAILSVLRHAASANRGVITPGDVEALQAEQDLLGEALAALKRIRHTHQYGHGIEWDGAWLDMCKVLAKAGK